MKTKYEDRLRNMEVTEFYRSRKCRLGSSHLFMGKWRNNPLIDYEKLNQSHLEHYLIVIYL